MTRVHAAIYRPGPRDPYMHASMSCNYKWHGHASLFPSPTLIDHNYRVTTVWDASIKGKKSCPECWVPGGYDALNDIVAGL